MSPGAGPRPRDSRKHTAIINGARAISIRVWIGRYEVFKKCCGPTDVDMSTGVVGHEPVLMLRRKEIGVDHEIRIGGPDVLRMLKTLAVDPHYRALFNPVWLETEVPIPPKREPPRRRPRPRQKRR